jgi:hypothetical protein
MTSTKDPAKEFHANRVMYITPHNGFVKSFRVYDITSNVKSPYPSNEFADEAEKVGQEMPESEAKWVFNHGEKSCTATVHAGGESDNAPIVAEWSQSRWQHNSNSFAFPEDSPHSSHNVIMKRTRFHKNECFVQDSVEYLWKFDGLFRLKLILTKNIGGNKIIVARYRGRFRAIKNG